MPVDCLSTDDVAMVVFGVKVSVGENVLSDMVTVVGVAVGTGDIETAGLFELDCSSVQELSPVEDDISTLKYSLKKC